MYLACQSSYIVLLIHSCKPMMQNFVPFCIINVMSNITPYPRNIGLSKSDLNLYTHLVSILWNFSGNCPGYIFRVPVNVKGENHHSMLYTSGSQTFLIYYNFMKYEHQITKNGCKLQ